MAVVPVSSIGTPVNTHATAGSVTGTWGIGQARAAGHVLVAVVSAASGTSTFITVDIATTSGWTQQILEPDYTTIHCAVALYTKTAAGADTAPVFTVTGTTPVAMDCVLFELLGANATTPVVTSGVYHSNSSTSGPLAAMSATTGASVAAANSLAISCFAQEATAGILTWVDTGAGGFTQSVLSGNGVSSVLQTAVLIDPSPATGAALTDTGAFSTHTGAYGAGLVAVFPPATPAPAGLEVFGDNTAATVTTGGTTAPAAGTSESWTVNTTGAFPLAAANYTQFHVADPALPAEKFLVNTAPGGTGSAQSWTVVRGADGTTPVAHAAGFSVVQVVGAPGLANFSQAFNVLAYGAQGNGTTDDTAAIQAAVNACITSGGGEVFLPAGVYQTSYTITVNTPLAVYIAGDGIQATTIMFYGTGDCLRVYNSALYTFTGGQGGGVRDLTFDGTNAGAGSAGLHMGDILQYKVACTAQNFTGAGSKGIWFDNQYYWTEQLQANIYAQNCTAHVVFDNAPGAASTATGSFERCDVVIWINQYNPNYDGVVLQNGAFFMDGAFALRGNFGTYTSALTSAVLRLTGTSPAGESPSTGSIINRCRLDIGVECDQSTGSNAPQTINFGAGGNYINQCYGIVDFAAAYPFTASNSNSQFGLLGVVLGDTNLALGLTIPGLVNISAGAYIGEYAAGVVTATAGTIATSGILYSPVTATAAVTGVILAAGLPDGQLVFVINTGSYPITFAAAATSNVAGGANVTIPAGTTQLYVWNYGAQRWYPAPAAPATVSLAAAFSGATGTSPQTVTGLSMVLPVGTFTLRGYLPVYSATAASTCTFAFTFGGTAAGTSIITWQPHNSAFAASITNATITTASGSQTTSLTTPAYYMEVTATIVVTATGTLQLTVTNGATADATRVAAGAFLQATQIA
jgi:hypothetical protein